MDTGGAYLILDPETGERLGLQPKGALGIRRLSIRGITVEGALHRHSVTLPANAGEPLTFEATILVPESWPLPPYVGWQGCLDRIRVAVDPAEDRFFFGAI